MRKHRDMFSGFHARVWIAPTNPPCSLITAHADGTRADFPDAQSTIALYTELHASAINMSTVGIRRRL